MSTGWREIDERIALRGYVAGGDDAVRRAVGSGSYGDLQGSFLLRVRDSADETWVTDRTGSRRAFVHGGSVSLDERPAGPAALDLGAIGSVLVNGYPLGGATLFAGVRALRPGSVTTVRDGQVTSTPYWSFTPAADLDRAEAAPLLADLLVQAVERHVTGPARLSLSAGYDARGILGILRHRLGRTDVTTFSYVHGTPAPASDAALSARLAAEAGYPHQLVESVDDDVVRVIEDNARLGRGLTNVCDEVRVWAHELDHDLPVVVGDECFGWNDVPVEGADDVLEAVYLHRSSGLRRLRDLVGTDRLGEIGTATDRLVDDAVAPHLGKRDPHDSKDSLYFAERLCRGLMPWRESFAGDGRQVLNPFLDGDVLDLVARLGSADRRGKALYRETVRGLVPEVFDVPFASTMGYSPDWRTVLVTASARIRETLATPSLLDPVIPPEAVDKLLTRCATPASRLRDQTARIGASLRARRQLAPLGRRIGWEVNDPTLLRRILVLRAALRPGR
ncbi:MAG: hypothetical protein J7518_09900 [Nocardioidaceae bacterium]|nr:hypothetical protein [Nocardioidaceae bacterium]